MSACESTVPVNPRPKNMPSIVPDDIVIRCMRVALHEGSCFGTVVLPLDGQGLGWTTIAQQWTDPLHVKRDEMLNGLWKFMGGSDD